MSNLEPSEHRRSFGSMVSDTRAKSGQKTADPVARLCIEVLRRALKDATKTTSVTSKKASVQRRRKDAQQWICSTSEAPWSVRWVCERIYSRLGYGPSARTVRRELADRLDAQTREVSSIS
jgi:hypothetical protein